MGGSSAKEERGEDDTDEGLEEEKLESEEGLVCANGTSSEAREG
jgi:hypothetical protein